MWYLTFGALCAILFGMPAMVASKSPKDIEEDMKFFQIIHDVISNAPPTILNMTYNKTKISLGTAISPLETAQLPTLNWEVDSSKSFYTLVMTDPDSPSMMKPTEKEWIHWLVVNIPGTNVKKGKTIVEYVGNEPLPDTGFHRHVILAYKQPKVLTFDEPYISKKELDKRQKFNTVEFAMKYKLGHPVAGNFFIAENVESVIRITDSTENVG